ncbi:hypothetical protein L3Y34_007608 [Caenorhabditis briggsae]|uniref:Gluconokinase n=1 Tax=Caenorhabditis briggsae TaxID=6238 RepID=A0AAE8ZZR1_CAEBR|nr:hypothetical protein L3Y34_007608 [Caenorhabditis briggsae]
MMLFFSTEEEKKKLASSTTTQTAAEQDCVSCKIIGTGSLFGIGCYIIFATRPVGYYATRPVTRQIIRSLSAVPFYASVARWMSNNDLTIFVMGVSGCGKSTIGSSLASRLNRTFKDGDTFHPPENIEKMRSGIPLTDEDRLPWLQLINAFARSNPGCVIACSALKKLYRSVLSENLPPTTEGNTGGGGMFVLLNLKREVLQKRVESRPGHFMPSILLDSQLATLEMPGSNEPNVIIIDADHSETHVVDSIIAQLNL